MVTKRFQIQLLVDEADYRTIKELAEKDSRSIASWVRIQLKAALKGLGQGSPQGVRRGREAPAASRARSNHRKPATMESEGQASVETTHPASGTAEDDDVPF